MLSFKEFNQSNDIILDQEFSKSSIDSLISSDQTSSSLALTQAPNPKIGYFSPYKKGPCSIVAIAALLNVTPEHLWNKMNFKKVWEKTGVRLFSMIHFMIPHTSEIIQGDFIRQFREEDSFTGEQVLNHFERNHTQGRWLISLSGTGSSGHVMAIVDQVIHDTCLPCTKKGYLKLDFKIKL